MRALFVALLAVFFYCEAEALLPIPKGQEVFEYPAIVLPDSNDSAKTSKPLGLGSVAAGGHLLTPVLTLAMDEESDVYVVFSVEVAEEEYWFQLSADGRLCAVADELVPWYSGKPSFVREKLLDVRADGLPAGVYTAYIGVTLKGTTEAFYIWKTFFEVPDEKKARLSNGAPIVEMYSPQAGELVGARLNVAGKVTDFCLSDKCAFSVILADILVDGQVRTSFEVQESDFDFVIDVSDLPDGEHEVIVRFWTDKGFWSQENRIFRILKAETKAYAVGNAPRARWQSPEMIIEVSSVLVDQDYMPVVAKAARRWETAGIKIDVRASDLAHVDFNRGKPGTIFIQLESTSNPRWVGEAKPSTWIGVVESCSIRVVSIMVSEAVVAHEIGHCLTLNHTTNGSAMDTPTRSLWIPHLTFEVVREVYSYFLPEEENYFW